MILVRSQCAYVIYYIKWNRRSYIAQTAMADERILHRYKTEIFRPGFREKCAKGNFRGGSEETSGKYVTRKRIVRLYNVYYTFSI